jgi:molecular chaperone HscA
VEASVQVKPSYGLADDDIARMLRESFSGAADDMRSRALREALVEAERMALATEAALAADGDLLDDAARDDIERLVRQARGAALGTDAEDITRAVERLTEGTEAFAAARMNRGIRAALTGRGLDEI